MIILFIIFNLWYWIAEGATEGFTWSTRSRRLNNKLIRPGIHDDPSYKTAKGLWCYHTWRSLGEYVGIAGMVISGALLITSGSSVLSLVFLLASTTMVCVFVYERFFNHVSYNELFPQKKSWDFLNGKIIIPRKPWHDWIILVVGIITMYLTLT